MARIPLPAELERGGPTPGISVARQNTTAEGQGLANIGGSIQDLGRGVSAFVEGQARKQNVLDLARADAAFNTRSIDVVNSFDQDPDYNTYGQRAQKSYATVVEDIAKGISDPEARELWRLSAMGKAAGAADNIRDRGFELKTQADVVAFDEALEANRRLYVAPETPETDRQRARADIEGSIQVALENGFLTPDQAEARATTYLDNADYNRGLLAVESGDFDGALPVVPEGSSAEGAAALLRQFEGFRETPYWDVNANRIGYGSDTITRADGSVEKVRPGMSVTRADAERDLARRSAEFERTAIGQVGPDAWAALPPNARAALTSVAYNYGSLPDRIIGAVKGGDVEAISAAVASLQDDNGGINRSRRLKEAAIIAGEGNPDWYTRLSPEQQADVTIKQSQRQSAVQKAEYAARKGAVELGILTGDVISEQTVLDSGLSASDTASLLRTFRAEMGDRQSIVAALSDFQNGSLTIDPYSTDGRKTVDGMYKAITETVAPEQQQAVTEDLVRQSGIVPQSLHNEIRRALGSTSPLEIEPALVQASRIADISPAILARREGGSDIQSKADMFNTYTGMGYSPAEAAQRIAASNDPEKARERDVLLKSKPVTDLLKQVNDRTISGLFPALPMRGVQVGENPAQSAAMVSEYKGLLEESIVDANGDVAAAEELAKTRFTRRYGASDMTLAGGDVVTRLPPEKTYSPLPDGSYDWIESQLHTAMEAEGFWVAANHPVQYKEGQAPTRAAATVGAVTAPAGTIPVDDVRFVAYDATDDDFKSGRPARYQVYYLSDGQWSLYNLPFVADQAGALADYEAEKAEAAARIEAEAEARRQEGLARQRLTVETQDQMPDDILYQLQAAQNEARARALAEGQ